MTDGQSTTERVSRRRARREAAEPEFGLMFPTVLAVEPLTAHMNRVTFGCDEVADFPFAGPDQWVKLFFPLPGQDLPPVPSGDDWYQDYLALPDDVRPPMRTYTIRRYDRSSRTFDIDMILHGDTGPGSAWAGRAAPGDRLGVFGPGAAYDPDPEHEWVLLVGDETALPAIGAILEDRDSRPVRALIEVDHPTDCVDLSGRQGEVTWLFRHGTPSAQSDLLVRMLRDLELPAGNGFVWLAGEAGKVKAARRHLVGERGIDRHDVCFIGYWKHGVSEDEQVGDPDEG